MNDTFIAWKYVTMNWRARAHDLIQQHIEEWERLCERDLPDAPISDI